MLCKSKKKKRIEGHVIIKKSCNPFGLQLFYYLTVN